MVDPPEEWAVVPFREVANYDAGRTPARAHSSYWLGEDLVPWVAISDMENYGTISQTREGISRSAFREVFKERIVPAGTLLMSFKLTIGRVATLAIPACHNEAIVSIYPKPELDQKYLGYFLSQVNYVELQDRQIKGNTLNQEKIDNIPISLPPRAEQERIANVLDCARRAIQTQARLHDISVKLKRSAMRELFTRGLRGEAQKESELGPIPESWNIARLGDLGRIGNGSTPKKSVAAYWHEAHFPWLTSAKVYDRNIDDADQYVSSVALVECHLPIIKPGAVLIAITGQGKTLGHAAVLKIEATINQHLAYLQTDTGKANPGFIRNYLEIQYEYLRQFGSGGGSTRGALTCAFLRTFPLPFPPLEQQTEIAETLDAIDRKIDLHKKKRTVLEKLFKALLRKLMTGEIRVDQLDLSALEKSA